MIPTTAALVTGTRAVVYVELPDAEEPTFEGREVVLGPRAGDYYLVRHGLEEGELVVAHGTFKIDSEIQIRAKPSMMTPEGGGGGGHDHGGSGTKSPGTSTSGAKHSGPSIPQEFGLQLEQLVVAYQTVTSVLEAQDLARIRTAFAQFANALESTNGELLSDHPAMQWRELEMLLSDDAFEGQQIKTADEARRVHALLKRHMERVREQLAVPHTDHANHAATKISVPAAFRSQLASLWQPYLQLQAALASDDSFEMAVAARQFRSALDEIDASTLEDRGQEVWNLSHSQIAAAVQAMLSTDQIEEVRVQLAPLSDNLTTLVETLGMGDVGDVYQLHCPMAFENRGASWLQDNPDVRNPYFGSKMLRCADSPRQIAGNPTPEHQGSASHNQ